MKIIIPCAALVLAQFSPLASATHDGDLFEDEIERTACGQADFAFVISNLFGLGGTCNEEHDYRLEALELGTECGPSRCTTVLYERTLQFQGYGTQPMPIPDDNVEPQGPIPIPFLNPDTATYETSYNNDGAYCITIRIYELQEEHQSCDPYVSNFYRPTEHEETPVMPYEDLGYTPGVEEGEYGTIEGTTTDHARIELRVSAQWDTSRMSPGPSVDFVQIWSPWDPLDASDTLWGATSTSTSYIEISWEVYDLDGDLAHQHDQRIPLVAQLLGGLYASA